MEEKKEKFIEAFTKTKGLITKACLSANIARNTYYYWFKNDDEFKQRAEEVLEEQIDFVESKLLDLIEKDDTTAVIFYLKTKGKNRGYSDKAIPIKGQSNNSDNPERKNNYKKKIKQVTGKIKKMLEKSDSYSEDLDLQIDLTAQLIAKTDFLAAEIFAEGHRSIITEYSREGNEREIISQKEKLYIEYNQKAQSALAKLGMTVDPKNKNVGEDGFGSFMEGLNDD